MNAHTTADSAPEKIFPALADLYNSLVFWTWVKCAVSFIAGFVLGKLL